MWLHLPASCRSVLATADLTSPSDSYFQELAQSCTASGKFHAHAFWRREWKMGRLTPLRSGMTCQPLTDAPGLEQWISSWRDSPASPIPSQASGKAPAITAGRSGMTSFASRGNVQLDLFSSKTSPACSPAPVEHPSPASAQTWTVRALRISPPASSVLRLSGHLIDETACLYWPTPTATSNTRGQHMDPQAGTDLGYAAKQWPTPTVHGDHNQRGLSPRSGDGLATAANQWPTPASRDWKDGRSNLHRNARPLNEVACRFSLQDPMPTGPQSTQTFGLRRLNPFFVEWLMGLPIGWTSLATTGCER